MSKETTIRLGDHVTVNDGSYATRVDKYELHSNISLCEDVFEVIGTRSRHLSSDGHNTVHDIFIKNTVSGAIYLHSADFVNKVASPAKEMTVSEISKELGYEVKVVK